jgi:dTDP-glucose 4,6-dehydratase
MTTYLVTGGCGFIGSNFILRLLRERPDAQLMPDADYVVHFAAETHVDRSLMEPGSFIQTDVFGTYTLLEAARQSPRLKRFLHVSTDEVYGEVMPSDPPSLETDAFRPRSPYSASKAGSEMQCRAYIETYGLPVVIARPANNVGPRQHVEKAVPLFATNAMLDLPLPLYGDGRQVRVRLFVEDHCEALDLLLHKGQDGEAYNIGAHNAMPNIEVAELVLDLLEKPRSLIRFVEDRAGHDRGYYLDFEKLRALGWEPRHDARQTIQKTVEWYLQNRWWWEPVRTSARFQQYYEEQYGKRLAEARPGPADQR